MSRELEISVAAWQNEVKSFLEKGVAAANGCNLAAVIESLEYAWTSFYNAPARKSPEEQQFFFPKWLETWKQLSKYKKEILNILEDEDICGYWKLGHLRG